MDKGNQLRIRFGFGGFAPKTESRAAAGLMKRSERGEAVSVQPFRDEPQMLQLWMRSLCLSDRLEWGCMSQVEELRSQGGWGGDEVVESEISLLGNSNVCLKKNHFCFMRGEFSFKQFLRKLISILLRSLNDKWYTSIQNKEKKEKKHQGSASLNAETVSISSHPSVSKLHHTNCSLTWSQELNKPNGSHRLENFCNLIISLDATLSDVDLMSLGMTSSLCDDRNLNRRLPRTPVCIVISFSWWPRDGRWQGRGCMRTAHYRCHSSNL